MADEFSGPNHVIGGFFDAQQRKFVPAAELAILRDPAAKPVIDRFLAGDTKAEPVPDSLWDQTDQG